jgi:hypothetical protein
MRYDLPKLAAFNFVLDDVLEGGVNASLGLDGHGKSLSFVLLQIPVHLEAERVSPRVQRPARSRASLWPRVYRAFGAADRLRSRREPQPPSGLSGQPGARDEG